MQVCLERCSQGLKTAVFVALVAALGLGAYLHFGFDEGIRKHVEGMFRRHYRNLDVKIRAARWIRGEGIELRGITIAERNGEGDRSVLVHVEELVVLGITDIKQLIASPRVERVIVRRPTIRATRAAEGAWSTAQLLPLPRFGAKPCAATIEDGRLLIVDETVGSPGSVELRQMHLTVVPRESAGNACELDLSGHLVSDHFRRADIKGRFDPTGAVWAMAGRVSGTQLSADLQQALPLPAHKLVDELGALQGVADFDFSVSRQGDQPVAFEVTGQLRQGRIHHPQLPYPLADVEAKVKLDNSGLVVEELTARNGPTTLWLSARIEGLTATSPVVIDTRVRQMVLDQRLQRGLPGAWRDAWHKFLPAGEVDADLKLAFDGTRWSPRACVYCRNVAFTYHRFPYRLERGEGSLDLVDNRLTIDLKAKSGGETVRVEGRIDNPGPGFTGRLVVKGESLQVNDKLLLALVENQRRVVQSLHPSGTFDIFVDLHRARADQPVAKFIWIGLRRCAVRCDDFPYPLDNVRGTVEVNGDHWEFRQLQATNDNGYVNGDGYLRPTPEGTELCLNIEGHNIPLEAELREALRPGVRRLWSELKPYGSVNVDAQIKVVSPQRRVDVRVEIEPVDKSVSIEPAAFPYRLEQLAGRAVYQNGQVTWERISGVHDRVTVASAGQCELLPTGGWRLQLSNLNVDRLHVDDDLDPALPRRMRTMLERLHWNGPVYIRQGRVELLGGIPDRPLTGTWNLALDTHGGSMNCGVPLTNMHGGAVVAGELNEQGLRCAGELRLDSASYRDVQFSAIRGPIYFDDESVRFGAWAVPVVQGQAPPRLIAEVDGGRLALDGWTTLGAPARYSVRGSLVAAELEELARDVGQGRQSMRGKASAEFDLQGTSEGRHTLAGGGKIELREADIYELPVMVALLKIVSVRPPDTTAFTKSDIEFRIEADHVYFDRIDFNGDAVSLCGKGQMDLERRIDLTFHAVVGRDELRVPVLREVMGEASQQILQIHIGGTVDNPTTYREAFPEVSRALQSLSGAPPVRR